MTRITAAVVIALFIPTVCFAKGKVAALKKGQAAPFAGVLLDKHAEAKITAKRETQIKVCDLEKDLLERKHQADCDVSRKTIIAQLEVNKSKYDQLMKIKINENERLVKTIEKLKKPDYSKYWFVGGFVAGVGLSIGIFYAAAQAAK